MPIRPCTVTGTRPAAAPDQAWLRVAKDRGLVAARFNGAFLDKEERLIEGLEALYSKYNHRKYVHPDPIEFLYNFSDPADREVAGLISACLAYGRVSGILKSVSSCLGKMGMRPRTFLMEQDVVDLKAAFSDFNYRFTKSGEMTRFLVGLKRLLKRHGTLEAAFVEAKGTHGNFPCLAMERLSAFVTTLLELSGMDKSYLLPDPRKKSACKRLFLFLRWMVRKDRVDPGGWSSLEPGDLIIPLDTHMFNIARELGFTTRRQAGLKSALEITGAFRRLNPQDPVKYDFVLTRFGIRRELSREDVPRLLSRP